MCIKSDFEEIILKLAIIGKEQRPFCCHQKCCLPLPGAIYMWKNKKKHVEIILKLATNGQSDKGFLLTSTFVPKGLSALLWGYIHV